MDAHDSMGRGETKTETQVLKVGKQRKRNKERDKKRPLFRSFVVVFSAIAKPFELVWSVRMSMSIRAFVGSCEISESIPFIHLYALIHS